MKALAMIAPFIIYNFLKYAKSVETINVNEWLTLINTKRNRAIITIAAVIDMIVVIINLAITLAKLPPAF